MPDIDPVPLVGDTWHKPIGGGFWRRVAVEKACPAGSGCWASYRYPNEAHVHISTYGPGDKLVRYRPAGLAAFTGAGGYRLHHRPELSTVTVTEVTPRA